MKETVQQYVARILGNVEGRNPMAVHRATPKKLAHLLRGLTAAQLRRRPAPGKWSIGEILAHLAESELVYGYRLRMILGRNGTPIQAFDQDAWAKNSNYARMSPAKSLALFGVLRAANLDLLGSLPRRKWRYSGVHAERGRETITHMVRLYAGHDVNHVRQIERIRHGFR